MTSNRLLLSFIGAILSLASFAQYTTNIGGDIKLYAPSSRDSKKPDLYDVNWKARGTGSVTLISSTSNPVTVRGVSAGTVTVTCSVRYFNKAKWTDPLYSGYIYENASYTITVNGNGGGGDTPGGGGDTPGGGGNDYTYFYETTDEGIPMYFCKGSVNGETALSVMPNCIRKSTTGKVTIPNYANDYPVRIISNGAFEDVSGLTELVIPSTVTFVDEYMTLGCNNLKTIICEATTPPKTPSKADPWLSDNRNAITLYVHQGSISKYKEANGWKQYGKILAIEGDPEAIPINEVNFPDDNFRMYLKNRFGDTLTGDEVEETTYIEINNVWFLNLKGIDYFKYLEELSCYWNIIEIDGLDLSKNTALKKLSLVKCQLSSLDVSNNKSLTYLDCSLNNIKGREMDDLINSLPFKAVSNKWDYNTFVVIGDSEDSEYEGNVCTTIQVENAKARGWEPCYLSYGSKMKYSGSDPSGIMDIHSEKTKNVSIFNLNGQQLMGPRKGINIIGGKKVVVK